MQYPFHWLYTKMVPQRVQKIIDIQNTHDNSNSNRTWSHGTASIRTSRAKSHFEFSPSFDAHQMHSEQIEGPQLEEAWWGEAKSPAYRSVCPRVLRVFVGSLFDKIHVVQKNIYASYNSRVIANVSIYHGRHTNFQSSTLHLALYKFTQTDCNRFHEVTHNANSMTSVLLFPELQTRLQMNYRKPLHIGHQSLVKWLSLDPGGTSSLQQAPSEPDKAVKSECCCIPNMHALSVVSREQHGAKPAYGFAWRHVCCICDLVPVWTTSLMICLCLLTIHWQTLASYRDSQPWPLCFDWNWEGRWGVFILLVGLTLPYGRPLHIANALL